MVTIGVISTSEPHWAMIAKMGRVVVETETVGAAREKAERKSHLLPLGGLSCSRLALMFLSCTNGDQERRGLGAP